MCIASRHWRKLVTLARACAQVQYGGMTGLPGGMPGYPGMYHQPQAYPYMAPYSLNAPYLGGMHPGFAAYPQACPPHALVPWGRRTLGLAVDPVNTQSIANFQSIDKCSGGLKCTPCARSRVSRRRSSGCKLVLLLLFLLLPSYWPSNLNFQHYLRLIQFDDYLWQYACMHSSFRWPVARTELRGLADSRVPAGAWPARQRMR